MQANDPKMPTEDRINWRTKSNMMKGNSAFAYEDGNRKGDKMTEAQKYLNRLEFEDFNRKIAMSN